MTLPEIAAALRAELEKHFQTVRLTAIQTAEQFAYEVKAIHPDKLPGVLIIFDRMSDNSDTGVRDFYFTVVLLDRFRASSDIRASSVFQAGGALLELFPAEGRELGGCWVHPVDCVTASPDKDFAALALGLECRTSF